jgi:hypothetical protein
VAFSLKSLSHEVPEILREKTIELNKYPVNQLVIKQFYHVSEHSKYKWGE